MVLFKVKSRVYPGITFSVEGGGGCLSLRPCRREGVGRFTDKERTDAETGRCGGGEGAKSHEYYNGGSFILYTIGISQNDQDLISLLT